MYSLAMHLICKLNEETGRKRDNDNRIVIVRSFDKLEVPCMPECYGVVQGGKYIFHPRPCVSILQPAQLDGPPQLVAESKLFRSLRFLRSDPFDDRIDR